MHKEQINDKEAISLISLFIMGSTLIIGVSSQAYNDAWLVGIAGILFSIPVFFIYSRIVSLFPGKDLFEILCFSFGKYIGKTVSLIYIWYVFHLGALVMRNFGEYVNTLTMPETPMIVMLLFLGAICIAAVRLGIEVMGRMCAYLIPVVLAIIAIVVVLGIPGYDFSSIKPILISGVTTVLKDGFIVFSFPFAETVVLGVFFSLKTKKSSRKVYFWGLMLAGPLIVIWVVRNIATLGELRNLFYFPSHVAVSHIKVGEFLQRIEVTVAFVFIVTAFVKISVCLFVACKGIGRVFNLVDYRSVVIQTGLLMIYFAYFVFDDIMDMLYWATKVYPYYAFPFQVVFPVIIWIIAEIRKKSITK
ncbi:MAG: endospore germination permease [Clostridiaceae bacterium]|nr:endospore germination permease [Clostridiaceae bacterium]